MIDIPRWQVHRGFWKGGVRENTLEAFRLAKQGGAEMVEFDIQISREGNLHVFHDFDLKRFFHVNQKVAKTPSEDLEGLGIPTLISVLLSEQVPDAVNIEIKSLDLVCLSMVQSLARTLEKCKTEKRIFISSFNPMALYWCGRLLPGVPRSLLIGNKKDLMSWKFPISFRLARPHFINTHYKLIDDEKCRDRLVQYERPLVVWTVNDMRRAKDYLTRGAVSVISDLLPPA